MNSEISTSLKILSILLILPLAVNAQNHKLVEQTSSKYIELTAGIAQPTNIGSNTKLNSTDHKYVGSIAFGKKISDKISIDLGLITTSKNESYSNGTNNVNKFSWKNKSTAAMLNVIFDLTNDQSSISPYIKVGAGISRNKSSDYIQNYITSTNSELTIIYKEKSNNSFAWQVGTGFNFKTHSKFDIQIQYMFANLGKSETQNFKTREYFQSSQTFNSDPIKAKLQNHTLTLGIKFKF